MRSRSSVFCGLLAFLAACGLFAHGGNAQDKDKDKDAKNKKPVVGALAPHKLDKAFERASRPGDITNALLNDPLFQKAVQDAFNAGVETAAARQKNPNMAGPTPGQAARQAFLRTLNDEPTTKKVEKKIKEKDKKVEVKDKKADKKVEEKDKKP